MCHNMSIYRRLNPRLLVQAGLGLGLLHWANMSNIYLYHPPSNSRRKLDKGLRLDKHEKISWRCRKECLEETTMKNVPIDQFWSFKRRNRAQNWNLCEKLSKIGPIGNFDFWSKVNWSRVKVNGYWSGSGQRSSSRSANVILWRVADVD